MSPSWMQLALLAVIVGIFLWLRKYAVSRIRGLPPVPFELPIVGSIPFLRVEPHVKLAQMGKKYGGIFMIHFGMTPTVIVTDGKLIRDVLLKQGHNFVGRADFFPTSMTFQSDISFTYHKYWKDAKSFAKSMLNKFGYTKGTVEPMVSDEASKLNEELMQFESQVVDLKYCFFSHILSVTWNMITGKNVSTDDPRSIKLKEDIAKVFQFINPSAPLNFFPFLRFIFPNSFHIKEGIKASNDINTMIQEEIRSDVKAMNSGEPQTFIEAYLQEIDRRKDDENDTSFNIKTLTYVVKNLIFGGSDTSDITIKWTILYLMHYREVQKKIQDELDSVVGPSRFPCYSDRYQLPYTMAVLTEVSRIASIVPFAVPHQCVKTSMVGGYKIPAGMIIYPNLWAMHHDPDIWGDPELFRPERFLDENGKLKDSEFLLPFGAGPRVCLGKNFGRLITFMFIVTIFHRFEIHTAPGVAAKDPNCFKPIDAFTLSPRSCMGLLKKRTIH